MDTLGLSLLVSLTIPFTFRSSSVQGKLLQHNLNADVVLALKDLKRKLSQ